MIRRKKVGIKKQPDMYECDICGLKEHEPATKNPPWVVYTEPESLIIRTICWHCCQSVKTAIKGLK